jgi:asparagine synthase (glutamine-hydrolysing)
MRKLQEVDIKSYLPGDLLFKVDMTSMANSLEVRSPFLDYRVVEFGLSLPRQFKFANRENKHLLREIARELVPKHLIDRPKMGFGIPRARWLRSELKQLVSDVILNSNFRNRNWFNYQEVEKVIQEHNRGKNLDHIIWPILMLELWALNWLDS